jgi:hypothetical protein
MILNIIDGPDDPEPATIGIDLGTNDDRSEAIVAGACLERVLERAVKQKLVRNDVLFSSFFKGDGPLATFSAKIDMAVLLGILNDQQARVLHTIRKIRNDFAHSTRPLHFDVQHISALCRNLTRVSDCQRGATAFSLGSIRPDTARAHYLGAVMLYVAMLEWPGDSALPPSPDKSG